MIITIMIAEGPQYHVNKILISGEKVTRRKIRALLKMKEGSVYSPKALHDDAKALADAYGSGGYVDLVICRRVRLLVLPESTCTIKSRKATARLYNESTLPVTRAPRTKSFAAKFWSHPAMSLTRFA